MKQSKLSFQKKKPEEKFIELPESYSQAKVPLIEGNTLIDKKEVKRKRGRPKKEEKEKKEKKSKS